MSKKAQKRLNRFLRMSGRTLRNGNNAKQHLASKRFERDVAAGGEGQLEEMARSVIEQGRAEAKALDKALEEALRRDLGVWG